MYAVIEIKGKQYRVEEGDRFVIPRFKADEGDEAEDRHARCEGRGGEARGYGPAARSQDPRIQVPA